MKNPLAILSVVWIWGRLDPHRWSRWNQVMVSLSILAFLPLQVPQIWRNLEVISSQDPLTIAHLKVIPVLGYASGMVANLLLMCYLADRQERWGAIVQGIGIVTSGIVVTQLFTVGLVNAHLFVVLGVGMVVGMGLNLFQLGRSPVELSVQPLDQTLEQSSDQTPIQTQKGTTGDLSQESSECDRQGFDRLWSLWKNGLNIIGLTLFPLILTWQLRESFLPTLSLGFGWAGSALLLGFSSTALLENRLPQQWVEHPYCAPMESVLHLLQRYWAVLSGWTANLLFMFGPAAQLMSNLVHPESIAALALPTQALSVLGNLLILARSGTLFIQGQDRVWAVGGLWEVSIRGLVFFTIAYYGFMPWLWFEGYVLGVILYGLWIYYNARPQPEVQDLFV